MAIKVVGLWADAEKTYIQSKPYLDALWHTVNDAIDTEINKQGLNSQVARAEKIMGDLQNGNTNI